MPIFNSKNSKTISKDMVDHVAGQTYAQTSDPATTWFAPLRPMTVVAPPSSPARALDYPAGINLVVNPRPGESVSYKDMRFVAENVTLVTMAVETRKDQIGKQRWDIRIKQDALEGLTPQQRLTAKKDPRLNALRDFLRHPDKEYTWDSWVRKLVHEVLVTDAPAIYMQRSLAGTPYALRLLDGATITRKINDDGTTPRPGQRGAAGQSNNPEDKSPYDTAYQQVIKGVPYMNFTTDELMFRPRNTRVNKFYGFSPTEQCIMYANIVARRDIFKLNTYTEGNIPPALASVTEDWTPDQIQEFQQGFDAVNAGDLAAQRKMQFIPKLSNLYMLKPDVLKDDADEWFARVIMFAFSLPPTALTKQMNRATAEQAQQAATDEGLAPLMLWLSSLMNDIIAQFFGFPDVEFVWTPERILDAKIQAEVHNFYLSNGTFNRNEIRAELGLDPIEDGDVYTFTTPNGLIPLVDSVQTTEAKIALGMMADPTAPKVAPAVAATPAEPAGVKDAKKAARMALAKHYEEIFEDLNPENRDPAIIAKLMEIERA